MNAIGSALLVTACFLKSMFPGNMPKPFPMVPSDIAPTDEIMGFNRVTGGGAAFRFYGPSVLRAHLVLFQTAEDKRGKTYRMVKKTTGVWELILPEEEIKKYGYYAYQVSGDKDHLGNGKTIADPYSKAVTRFNHWTQPSKTILMDDEEYDWEDDDYTHMKLKDMVIYEVHMRDMTVHPSSGGKMPGTYLGFVEQEQKGGIRELKDMGFNAVEFLPLQEFADIEVDYKNPKCDIFNDWNPYESNHWGYMTSFYFAPETYYGTDGTKERGRWVGKDGRAVRELKKMVRELHKEGLAVIVDVVYNHVSVFDENPLKLIDKETYFRFEEDGTWRSHSGCGNDMQTDNAMCRKLIVESLVHWVKEYHVDGFRFDLAAMIDLDTVDAITKALQEINPDVVLIGEPWGGGYYNPDLLAEHGWASWNDCFRNSIKGREPQFMDTGFIFGDLWGGKDKHYYTRLFAGFLRGDGGNYQHPSQNVNYLESHDDYTLGDFVRHVTEKYPKDTRTLRKYACQLNTEETQIHKLAALCLLTAQGPVMIAEGQTWGRAKVIENSVGLDANMGKLDHNSYGKDDETNWLDWAEKEQNKDLVDYYRGLIAIRAKFDELRDDQPGFRSFVNGEIDMSWGVKMKKKDEILVLLNGDKFLEATYNLEGSEWIVLANCDHADPNGICEVMGTYTVPIRSGVILVRKTAHTLPLRGAEGPAGSGIPAEPSAVGPIGGEPGDELAPAPDDGPIRLG